MIEEHAVAFAIVTTCKNRLPFLQQTLPANLKTFEKHPAFRLYVLDHGCPQGTTDWAMNTFPSEIAAGRLVLFTNQQNPQWSYPHAKNCVTRLACEDGCDVFYNMDADNFAGSHLPERLMYEFGEGQKNIIMHAQGGMGTGGRLGMRHEDFVRVGGYDEDMKFGWGYEDEDLKLRCVGTGMDMVYEDHWARVLQHSDKLREHYQCMRKIQSCTANYELAYRKRQMGEWIVNQNRTWGKVKAWRNMRDVVEIK